MVYYCRMSDTTPASPPVKKIVKYRSKQKIHDAVTDALDGKLTPAPVVKSDAPVVVKRGPKPDVVKNFNDDPRSMDLSVYILQGLSIEEAGILAKFSPEELKNLQERSESYRRFVELQMIKFKQKHLKVISDKDNPNTSMWMLEQKFPETFGKKAKETSSNGMGSTQIIQAIVKSVQMSNDVIVHEHEDNNEKEGQDNSTAHVAGGNQPSLEPGGANIL